MKLKRQSSRSKCIHIANAFDGTAKELLDKYDQRGETRATCKASGIWKIHLEQRLKELKWRRVAANYQFATAASRDSDSFTFFDEPSSDADVFQRTGVARVIHSLAEHRKKRDGGENTI